jgi:catechol 2,3-dioxygenase-like lactoylglutathione lyase family enzyme
MITRLDLIGIPSQDPDRARSFYRDTLGLRPDEHGDYEQWAGGTCFGIWEPKKMGMPFVAQKGNPWPLCARPRSGAAQSSGRSPD